VMTQVDHGLTNVNRLNSADLVISVNDAKNLGHHNRARGSSAQVDPPTQQRLHKGEPAGVAEDADAGAQSMCVSD
jgi:hypothetical protein